MLVIISCATSDNYPNFNLIHVQNIDFQEQIYKDFFQPNNFPLTMACPKYNKNLTPNDNISM